MVEGKCVKCGKKTIGSHPTLIPFRCHDCLKKEFERDAYFSKRAVMEKLLNLNVPHWNVKCLEELCETDSVFRNNWNIFLETHSPAFPEDWLESLTRLGKVFVKKKIKEPYKKRIKNEQKKRRN
jgi:hypothetical protein